MKLTVYSPDCMVGFGNVNGFIKSQMLMAKLKSPNSRLMNSEECSETQKVDVL